MAAAFEVRFGDDPLADKVSAMVGSKAAPIKRTAFCNGWVGDCNGWLAELPAAMHTV
jgi:hypothetical protein